MVEEENGGRRDERGKAVASGGEAGMRGVPVVRAMGEMTRVGQERGCVCCGMG